MQFHISSACWHHYPQDASKELIASHQPLFPGYETSAEPVNPCYGPWERADEPYVDPWGCLWETTDNGIVGRVTRHPLEHWEDFESCTPPAPKMDCVWRPVEWDDVPEELRRAKDERVWQQVVSEMVAYSFFSSTSGDTRISCSISIWWMKSRDYAT